MSKVLPPPRPPLFPYTTLFRSYRLAGDAHRRAVVGVADGDRQRVGLVSGFDARLRQEIADHGQPPQDRKSTRLNSSHLGISYAVFCLKKKNGHVDLI